jgi:5'-nucleotidase
MGIHNEGIRFDVAETHGAAIIRKLIDLQLGPGILVNINFPDCRPDEVASVEVTRQGKRDQNLLIVDERMDLRGHGYYWLGFKRERGNPPVGTDLRAVFDKRISVTPLHMNLTHIEAMEAVRLALDAK